MACFINGLESDEKKLRAGAGTTFVVLELQEDFENAAVSEIATVTDYNNDAVEFRSRPQKRKPGRRPCHNDL